MGRLGILVTATLLLSTTELFALPAPVKEWTLDTKVPLGASPVAFPTSTPDSVLVGVGGHVLRVSGKGEVMWHAEFGPEPGRGGLYEACPADLDGDGVEEVIGGHKGGFVVALDSETGDLLWEFNLGSSLDSWEMARAADLDGDGQAEVVASAQNGWIYCLNGDGSLRWRSRMENFQPSTVSIGDINGDGRLEIVYGTATRHLIALDAEGRLLWDAFLPPHHLGRTAPLLADLNNDGEVEIYSLSSMVAPDTGVVSVNGKDGSLRWEGPHWSKAYMGRTVAQFDNGSRGLITSDKGNYVVASNADGTQRWKVQLNGRGMWTPGSCADVDGDGKHELLFNVRDRSHDGKNVSLYVLNAQGETLGAFDAGRGFGQPLVGDIDGDGVLEVVMNTRDGILTAYSFGGAAREGAVISTGWINEAFLPKVAVEVTTRKTRTTSSARPEKLEEMGYGENPGYLHTSPEVAYVEIAGTDASGVRQVERFKVDGGGTEVAFPLYATGRHQYTARHLDKKGAVLAEEQFRARVPRPGKELELAVWEVVNELYEVQATLEAEGAAEAGLLAEHQAIELLSTLAAIEARIGGAEAMEVVEQDQLATDIALFREKLAYAEGLAGLALAAGGQTPFVLWEDENPWDNVEPECGLPGSTDPAEIRLWAFGNETESVCVNMVNLSGHRQTLRIDPGTITSLQAEAKPTPAEAHATLMRVAWVPSRLERTVGDLLPKLDAGNLIDLAPGEVRQVWINVSTKDLEPGAYTLEWPVRTLDQASYTQPLRVKLEVSPVRLPEKSRYLINLWAQNVLQGVSTVEDLNEHLLTVWYQLPLPALKADAEGNLVGEADWTAHDAILSRAKQVELIIYGWLPSPAFPEDVKPSEEIQLKAQRAAAKLLVDHLAKFGLGYEHFCFYVEDEPGLTGSIDHYMERARALKAIDPKLQTYANPWEAVWTERIEEMWPITDVWQPGMELIEYHGPEFVAAMKKGGKPVMMYTPPGDTRVLKPLGFYRAQPWQSFHWGIEGGGWFVYYGNDSAWITDPVKEPGFGAVAFDGRTIVTTRRWEATRDGIEDFNALTRLGELAEAKQDAAAQAVLKAAVDYVADATITGMPVAAGGYDVEFLKFQEHRQGVREALERVSR